MEIIELERVNYQQAKSLRDVGFPQDHGKLGARYTEPLNPIKSIVWAYDSNDSYYAAPYLEEVNKFFREYKNLSCEPYRTAAGWICMIVKIPTGSDLVHLGSKGEGDDEDSGQFTTYERALSAGIDRVIEILKSEKFS